jgi:hypothetical protein
MTLLSLATGHKTKKMSHVTNQKKVSDRLIITVGWSRRAAGVGRTSRRGKTFFFFLEAGRQVVTVEVDPSEGKEKHFIKPTLSSNFTVLDIDIAATAGQA